MSGLHTKRDQFWILDGHGLIYRAIFRPGPKLTAPGSDEPTRGTYTFVRMLKSLVAEHKPAYFAMAVDAPRASTFRRKLYPAYKMNRDDAIPEEVVVQVRRIYELVKALGIPLIGADEFEADDVIAALVDVCASDEVECVVCSADKDLNQLVGPNCRQYDPSTEKWLDHRAVVEKWGVRPDQIVDVMTLMGDSTDNIPGVKGIGEKGAVALIKRWGTLASVLEHSEELTEGQRKNILKADLSLCRKLVELRKDVQLDCTSHELEFNGLDLKGALKLFRELGFQSLL